WELIHQALEACKADVAPGTDVVRDEVNMQRGLLFRLRRRRRLDGARMALDIGVTIEANDPRFHTRAELKHRLVYYRARYDNAWDRPLADQQSKDHGSRSGRGRAG